MNFELEPWELPPNTEQNVEISIEFETTDFIGQNWTVSARWAALPKYRTGAFVRFHRSNTNFIVVSEGSNKISTFSKTNSKILGQFARQAIEGEGFRLARLFCLEGELSLLFPGEIFWKRRSKKHGGDTVFALPEEIRSGSSAHIFGWLQQQWTQPDSQVRFSWEWNRKSLDEQQAYFARTVARWRELTDLMRIIATANRLAPGQNWMPARGESALQAPTLQANLLRWAALLDAHFPAFEPLPESQPRCARDAFHFARQHIQVAGAEVSAHQQIEAQLTLRDWLRHHAPKHLNLVQ